MFVLNDEDKSIYATRGDIVFFSVTATDEGEEYKFKAGDLVRIKVFGKKDAEDVVLVQAHSARQSGDVAVVVDRERNAPVLLDAEEHVLGGLELRGILLLDGAEERGDAHLLADERTGRRAADGVDARKSGGGGLKTFCKLLIVIFRIRIVAGIPRELLGKFSSRVLTSEPYC